jgi:hypothetical protein
MLKIDAIISTTMARMLNKSHYLVVQPPIGTP